MEKACRKCRREGEKLMLKGERCLNSAKCAVAKRRYAPGAHGQSFHGKMSEYGKQLREKQKARRIYGVSESQFRGYALKVNQMVGNKSENLIRLLETRVDNIVYRLGFASSRSQARQYVAHGLFMMNGKTIKTPSIQAKINDQISPKKVKMFAEIDLGLTSTWLEADNKKKMAKVLHLPIRDEIDTPINENLIIEYYSR